MFKSPETKPQLHVICPNCVKAGFTRDPREINPKVPVIENPCSTHRLKTKAAPPLKNDCF